MGNVSVQSSQFVAAVRERAQLSSLQEAERVCHVVLSVLGERFGDVETREIAAELPGPLGRTFAAAPSEGDLAIDALFDEVRAREEVSLSLAEEHTQVVCEVLGETLDEGLRGHLAMLPSPLADLFRRAEPALAPGEGPVGDESLDAADEEDDLAVDPEPAEMARRWLHHATEDE